MKIEWSPAARASARRYLEDQDGMRAIGHSRRRAGRHPLPAVRARTPARRWETPADLVGPAVWLASRASGFVNGRVIYVDGGITAVL